MIVTERFCIVEATCEEVKTIIRIESHKDNKDFIWIGTEEEHLAEIQDPNHFLWLFKEKDDNRIVGYGLARVDRKSNVFELRRIAITEKGKGYGEEAIRAILAFAFLEQNTNRFWLDVYPDNVVGIKLYEKLGLHRDGILRQNYKADRGYLDQIIYSMLRTEYFSKRKDDLA